MKGKTDYMVIHLPETTEKTNQKYVENTALFA